MVHVGWQRRILIRDGYWGHWSEYHDMYDEGRPAMVGRFRCQYRKIFAEE